MSLMAAILTTVEKQNGVETRDGGFWIGKGKIKIVLTGIQV